MGAQAWVVGAHTRFKEEMWPLLGAARERGERQRGERAFFSNGFSLQPPTRVFHGLHLSFSAFKKMMVPTPGDFSHICFPHSLPPYSFQITGILYTVHVVCSVLHTDKNKTFFTQPPPRTNFCLSGGELAPAGNGWETGSWKPAAWRPGKLLAGVGLLRNRGELGRVRGGSHLAGWEPSFVHPLPLVVAGLDVGSRLEVISQQKCENLCSHILDGKLLPAPSSWLGSHAVLIPGEAQGKRPQEVPQWHMDYFQLKSTGL